jgi:uncharacterized phage protein (TIGR01671 family)
MREILFRGKRADNGQLVYGFYAQELQGQHYILADEGDFYDGPMLTMVEIIPETVGQYTGLKDKNGVKIFEGDILRGSMVNLIVAYEGAGFISYWMDHDYGYGTEKMWRNLVEGGEVIGNIHDNPELMGETE